MTPRGIVPCVWLAALFAVSPAPAQDAASFDARIAQLEQQCEYLEAEHYEIGPRSRSMERELEQGKDDVKNAEFLQARLDQLDARLTAKEAEIGKARGDCARTEREMRTPFGYPVVRSPQTNIPRMLGQAYDYLWGARSALAEERTKIDHELRGSIAVTPDGINQRFKSLDDFRRHVTTAVWRSKLSAARQKTLTAEIEAGNRRRLAIKEEVQRKRNQIDRLKRERDQLAVTPTPPSPPARSPRVAKPEIVGAEHSAVEGQEGKRYCTWRFYIRLLEGNNAPVRLRLTQIRREPEAQDPDPRRRFSDPVHRFTVAAGEEVQLGGYVHAETGLEIVELDLQRQFTPHVPAEAAPSQRDLGPYYLTVWEESGFLGRFTAAFESPQDAPYNFNFVVEFVPPKPALQRVQMDVRYPDERGLNGTGYHDVQSLAWSDPYHLHFEVRVPGLMEGLHRLCVRVNGATDLFIWARAKASDQTTTFTGQLPMPLGELELLVFLPDAPHIAPVTLRGRLQPKYNDLQGSLQKLRENERKYRGPAPQGAFGGQSRYWQWYLGDTLLEIAIKYNLAGEYGTALKTANEAAEYLPEKSETSTYAGRHERQDAMREIATAFYHLYDAGAFQGAVSELAAGHLRAADMYANEGNPGAARVSQEYAGRALLFAARRLLILGATPGDVRTVIDQGNALLQRGGAKPQPTPWLPN
ncbi:MAG: hypothetical protein V2A76_04610 [Planctomycetota bacterium]